MTVSLLHQGHMLYTEHVLSVQHAQKSQFSVSV